MYVCMQPLNSIKFEHVKVCIFWARSILCISNIDVTTSALEKNIYHNCKKNQEQELAQNETKQQFSYNH